MKKLITTLLVLSITSPLYAAPKKKSVKKTAPTQQTSQTDASLKKDFSSLGDNQVFAERVKNMDADRKVRIVQNRIVDLNNRLEFIGNYGMNGGGQSYVTSQRVGGQIDYHFNPRWAVGVRYEKYYNELTAEGDTQYRNFRNALINDPASQPVRPDIDFPLSSTIATISYAPIYGKLNLFDLSVAHFDVYGVIGAGKMQLDSGSSMLYTAGGGISVWMTQHFATHFEARYLSYQDMIGSKDRNQNGMQGMLSIGLLL